MADLHPESEHYDEYFGEAGENDNPGEKCGRWRNGTLVSHCLLAGTEFCDFDCPYRA